MSPAKGWVTLGRVALLMLGSPGAASAQDPDYYDEVNVVEGTGMMSAASSGGAEWETWYGNQQNACESWSHSNGRPVNLTIRLWLLANGQVLQSITKSGWKEVRASIPFDPLNSSPANFLCVLHGVTGNQLTVESHSTAFRGVYRRVVWDYDMITYNPVDGCSHIAVIPPVFLANPAPGYPNVNDPPSFMDDDGFWFKAPTYAYPMRFYRPRNTQSTCFAPAVS